MSIRTLGMKKSKRRKNICLRCKSKMQKEFEECMLCGGGEYYECKKCQRIFDMTGEEI